MKKIVERFSTPLFLLVLCILAYGIQALWLGYYLDDWVVLYHIHRGGLLRLTLYSFGVNRPFGAWPWWVGFNLLGYSPVLWQLWSMLFRWLAVVFLWWGWKEIWPEKKTSLSLAAALAVVYPIFLQQSNAVTFSDHWICLWLFAVSILLMVLSVKIPRFYFWFTALGLVASALQLFTIEYFVGLELIRPVLLWFLLRDRRETGARVRKTIYIAVPYALLFIFFVVWRFVFIPTSGADRNNPGALLGFFSRPIQTLTNLAVGGIRDIVEAVAGAWYQTYQPATIAVTPLATLVSWGVVVLAAVLAYVFYRRAFQEGDEASGGKRASLAWMGLALLVMLAGFLPGWSINKFLVSPSNYSDRFGLAAMFGASLLLVAILRHFLSPRQSTALVCLLISLATGFQFRLANEYRWSWETRSRLAAQFLWRMPGLQPHTAIYGDGVLANGSWVDIAFLNFLYSRPSTVGTDDYWYYDLTKMTENGLPDPGVDLVEQRLESLYYRGGSSDSLVIQFKSVPNQCVWLLDGTDSDNPYLDPTVKSALHLSNRGRILPDAAPRPDLALIFRVKPSDQWCYYYQKAALAAQQQRWDDIRRLWAEAEASKVNTSVAYEYLPFIDGLARAGDLPAALAVSRRAGSLDWQMNAPLCRVWAGIAQEVPAGQEIDQAMQEINDRYNCQ